MTSTEIIAIILTSTVVSGFIAFVLRYFFESKQQHRLKMEFEKFKVELGISEDIQREIANKKLKGYPLLVELVSRTRSKARYICKTTREIDSVDYGYTSALAKEFDSIFRELDKSLYTFKRYLDMDGIFAKIHEYKNLIYTFNVDLSNYMKYLQSQGAEQQIMIQETVQELQDLFSKIDDAYNPIMEELGRAHTAVTDVTLPKSTAG